MAMTCGAIRLMSARPRSDLLWPRPARASGSMNLSKATARRLRPCLQDGARRHRVEAQGLGLPFRPLARLAQNEKLGCASREAGRRGRLGQQETAMNAKNRIMIYGPNYPYVVLVNVATMIELERLREIARAAASRF